MANAALTLRAETAFTNAAGERRDNLEREQRKRFEVVRRLVAAVAEPGEDVLYVAAATAPFSTMEFLTTGWILMSLKRCFLVVTDRRLLHVPLSIRGKSKHSIAEVRYSDVKAIKVEGLLNGFVELVYRSGKKERFSQLRGYEKKKLVALLDGKASPAPVPSQGAARHFLCPRCARRWAGEETCPQCGLRFKNQKLAFWLAVLAPGGGYFYTNHVWLGIADAFAEVFLLVLLIFGLVALALRDADALPVLAVAAIGLTMEKLISVYHVRHYLSEALPADTTFEPAA
jgi:hypothetical protein